MAIIESKNLSFKYNNSAEYALKDINLTINEGEFVVVCGESGCGKSTLLKLLKKQLQPAGELSGEITYNGVNISELVDKVAVTDIGFVSQNPDNQIITDKVYHELAFGLESLGYDSDTIRTRVAEICGFFGISTWYNKETSLLSGGQKQLLNLASVMIMQPKVLVLDEPTSQLDPIAATDFIATLKKINDELGVTIVLVEHRLEDVFPICDKVALMNKASVLFFDEPKTVCQKLKNIEGGHKMLLGLPSATRIFNNFNFDEPCPITVKEGKQFLQKHFTNKYNHYDVANIDYSKKEKVIEIKEGFFRYERNTPDVLTGLNLTVYKNEILCILGGNGAGKTTTLKILSGLNRLYRGSYRLFGKKLKEFKPNTLYRHNICMLPQNPQALFVKKTIREDLDETVKVMGYEKNEGIDLIRETVNKLQIEHLLDKHPFDLSGGEQQKCALCKALLVKPKIILMDEPTKGLDAYYKSVLANILYELKESGMTIVIVTHDIEFASEHSDRCAMFFDGKIVASSNPIDFFSSNSYYTTAASRISRSLYKNAITVDMVTELANKNLENNG